MNIIIPSRLKVGGHTYEIILDKRYYEMENYIGASKRHALRIVIDDGTDTPISIKEETFIHELLHTIFVEAGFNLNANVEMKITEEELVGRLTPVLYQILIENKLQE